ncbi:MAG: hypothetical protein KBE02_01465 [Sulfurospirillum sp.]|nr:hypothetical protein [Sulfurospirillum sp.]
MTAVVGNTKISLMERLFLGKKSFIVTFDEEQEETLTYYHSSFKSAANDFSFLKEVAEKMLKKSPKKSS